MSPINVNSPMVRLQRFWAAVQNNQGRQHLLREYDTNGDNQLTTADGQGAIQAIREMLSLRTANLPANLRQAQLALMQVLGQISPQNQQLPQGITQNMVNQGNVTVPPNLAALMSGYAFGVAGRTVNVHAGNPGNLITRALQQGQAPQNATLQQQGEAVARGFWSNRHFSPRELFALYAHTRGMQPNDRQQFMQGFLSEYTNQIQTLFPDPRQQRFITMQLVRFRAMLGNENSEFGELLGSLGNAMVRDLPAFANLRQQLQANPGNPQIAATYNIPGESSLFGTGALRVTMVNGQIVTHFDRLTQGLHMARIRLNFDPNANQFVNPNLPGFAAVQLQAGNVSRVGVVSHLNNGVPVSPPAVNAGNIAQALADMQNFQLPANPGPNNEPAWTNGMPVFMRRQAYMFLAQYATAISQHYPAGSADRQTWAQRAQQYQNLTQNIT